MRVIKEVGSFRIVEKPDLNADFEDLCGDCYTPELHPEIPREKILKEKEKFRGEVNRKGVYGYELQKWNPEVGKGWSHVDSCWGFVGQYSESDERYKHYIVEELSDQMSE